MRSRDLPGALIGVLAAARATPLAASEGSFEGCQRGSHGGCSATFVAITSAV